MELKQLEYFLAVSQELHFTRAAEKLNISQPSLSQQIRALEQEVGVPLFDRIGKRTTLTEAGNILLSHTLKIFQELEQAGAALRELNGLARGKLRIGALLTVVNYLLPPTLQAFHQQYPNIELTVLGLRMGDIRRGLLENELDLGIVFLPMDEDEFESIPLYTEELSLAVSTGHPLAGHSFVTLDVLKETPAILLPENYYLRQLIDRHCAELGFTPRPVLEMTTMESLIHMVSLGMGVTVLPRPYLECLQHPEISVISFSAPVPMREIGILYRKDKFMCTATRVFIDKLTGTVHSIKK